MSALLLALAALALAPQDTVVIIADDVGTPDLERVATPHIDALAAAGVAFRAATAMPSCSVTRRTVLFGEWWRQESGEPCEPATPAAPPLELVALPELCPGTSVLVGKWHVGGAHVPGACAPIEQGFDWWLAGTPANVPGCGGTGYFRWTRVTAGPGGCSARLETDYAPRRQRAAFLAACRSGVRGPRLLVLSPNLAHAPYVRPTADLLPDGYPDTPETEDRYEAMIVALDRIVGDVLAAVDLERTLVVFFGDNGTPPGFAPRHGRAKGSVYERGVRVPLIFAGGPVTEMGAESDELVHVVDVYATVAEWSGASVPASSPSRSLLATLTGAAHAPYHEYVACGDEDERAARSSTHKLVQRDLDGDGTFEVEEFYDLGALGDDGLPSEELDLDADPDVQALVAVHRAWLESALP